MIDKDTWEQVKNSKKLLCEATKEEIQKYLEEGNLITRREKGGVITYWELAPDGKNLKQVEVKEK